MESFATFFSRTDRIMLQSAAYEYFQHRSVLGCRENGEQNRGLILYVWTIKMVKAICQTGAVCQTSTWSKCAQETALLTTSVLAIAYVHPALCNEADLICCSWNDFADNNNLKLDHLKLGAQECSAKIN